MNLQFISMIVSSLRDYFIVSVYKFQFVMKIARFASYALAGLSVLFALSCTKNKEEEKPASEASSAKFKVALNLVESNRAEVIVRHDGKDSDTWFGFITDDIETPEADLIQAQLPNVSKSTLHVGAIQTVEVKNLEEYSKYRYIAFGVTEDKELFGTPGSLVFSTNPDLDAKFAVEVSAVTSSSAKASVTMEGKSYLTYYVAISEDTTSSDAEIAAAAYSDIVKDGELLEGVKLLTGASNELSFETLKADTQYSVVAFGVFVDEDGSALYYGTPAVAKFATTPDYSKVEFTATATSIGKNAATFDISYNTASDLTWYAFVSSDLETAAASLIADAIKGVATEDLKTGKTSFTAENLAATSNYRLIVTGVKDGATYGIPADLKFATADDDYDQIVFTAELLESNITSAKVKVTNSVENENLKWVYVVSTDMTSDANSLMPAADDVQEADINTGIGVEITLSDLSPKTDYRMIVRGYRVDTSGDKYLYGVAADLSFKTTSFYQENQDWTVTVTSGDTTYEGYPFKVTNTVASASSDKYFFTVYKKNIVDPFNGDLDGFISSIIEAEVEDLQAEAKEAGKTLADILYSGTGSTYYRLQFGTYYMFAIGLSDTGEPTGSFAYTVYTNEPSEEDKAAYNKWLGNWVSSNGLITVEAKELCSSYTVSGIVPALSGTGFDGVIETSFGTNGNMLFNSYTITNYTDSSYGSIDIAFEGCMPRSDGNGYSPISGNYTIAEAVLSADGKSAQIQPKTINLASGSSVTLSGMNVYGHILGGEYAGYYLTYNVAADPFMLPAAINRPSDSGSDSYNKWLGNWDVIGRNVADTADSTFFSVNIAKNVADVSFSVSSTWGLFDDEKPATMKFNSTTGDLQINIATLLEDQQVFSDTSEKFDIKICGFFDYQGKSYYDDTEGNVLATVSMASNGSTSVAAGEFMSGINYTFINAMAVNDDGAYRLWYPANLNIPFKFQKSAGTTSVKSVSPQSRRVSGKDVSFDRKSVSLNQDYPQKAAYLPVRSK